MAKIKLNNVTFYYTDMEQPIFKNINFSLDTGWRLGLIGRNGRGKTTLLRLIHGDLEAKSGTIVKEVTPHLFPYQVNTEFHRTIDVIKENIAKIATIETKMQQCLLENTKDSLKEYEKLLEQYMEADGYTIESRIKKELHLMQMKEAILEQEYETLSGGEKTRIQIISLFLRKDSFILLDEPTEHLDVEGKKILINYLNKKSGYIVVSHDKNFLDEVTDHILAINKATVELEKGTYSSWKENMERKEIFELKAEEKLKREISQLERTSQKHQNWAEVGNKQKYDFCGNFRANGAKSYLHQAKRAQERIEDDLKAKKELLKNMEQKRNLSILQEEAEEDMLLRIHGLNFGYEERQILENVCFHIKAGDRLWLRGKNGSGKSTLIRLIMEVWQNKLFFPKEQLEINEKIIISLASQEGFWKCGVLKELVKDKEQYDKIVETATSFDLSEELLKRPIETFSSGERRKLDIARALADTNQLLIMDEPLNYMDVLFREQLEEAILKSEPTLLFVGHDEQFGKRVATKTYELS